MRLDGKRTGVRTQSSLGSDFQRNSGASRNIDRISLGNVTQVNYRYNTVEVHVPTNGTQTATHAGTDGKYSARLPVQFSGTTKDGKAFGQVNPIEIGSSVLIGFLEGDKANPIVLGVYGKENESYNLARTTLSGADPRNEQVKQETQHQFTVYPSLTYKDIDGAGNTTTSFTGKSFLTMKADSSPLSNGLFDDGDGFGYEGLNSSYYYTGELIEPKEGRAPVILFKHQGDVIDDVSGEVEEDTHNFMMFLDQDGTYRLSTLDTDDSWRGVFEMTRDGKIGMRHQKDTKKLNTSDDYNEIAVDEEGILFRVGDKWSKITPNGTYGTLNIGGGGAGGGVIGGDGDFEVPTDPSGSQALDRVREDIERYLNIAERNIVTMETYMERTAGYITQGASMVEEFRDEVAIYESNLTQLAERIMTEVASTQLPKMVEREMEQYRQELDDLSEETKDNIATLQGLVNDNILSDLDKEIVKALWESIRAEKPGLIYQAETNNVDTAVYEQRYQELDEYLAPYFEDMGTSQEINGDEFVLRFQHYYNERNKLVQGVYDALSADIMEALRRSADATTQANKSLGSSGSALNRALGVRDLLEDLVEDGVLTPHERTQVLNQWVMIENEYPQVIEEIRLFNTMDDGTDNPPEGEEPITRHVSVDTAAYESAYDTLEHYIQNILNLYNNPGEPLNVDGTQLVDNFTDYYLELSNMQADLARANVQLLKEYDGDFKRLRTRIVETDREITFMADRVEAVDEVVQANSAELSVQATQITQRVTGTTFRREIDQNRHTLNTTGRNLYSTTTAIEGTVLHEQTGETIGRSTGEVSMPIDVKGGYVHTLSIYGNESPNTVTAVAYDAVGDVLRVESFSMRDGQQETIPLPSNTSYVRVSVNNANDGYVQFEQGHGTGYFMYSNADLIANLEYATEEAQRREVIWKDIQTKRDSFTSRGQQDLRRVQDTVADDVITSSEATDLQNILTDLETRHETTVQDARDAGLGVNLLLGSYESLTAYLDDLLGNTPPIAVNSSEVVIDLFETYFERLEDVYQELTRRYRTAYEASVEVLDDVLAGNLEAERVARDLAEAAANAAQSVSTLRYERDSGRFDMQEYMDTVESISENGQVTPNEKIQLKPIKEYIDNEYIWLITQSNAIGLSNQDLTNAYNTLDSYLSEMTAGTKKNETSTVTVDTFRRHFQHFFDSKDTLLGLMIEEVTKLAERTEEDARLARQETIRRDHRLDELRNILHDSELAIERLEHNIEDLQKQHAYTIEIMSTNGFTFRDRVVQTSLEVTVYEDVEDITQVIPDENFEWEKKDKNGNVDQAWTNAHRGAGPRVDLDHTDVTGYGLFTCVVYLDVEVEE